MCGGVYYKYYTKHLIHYVLYHPTRTSLRQPLHGYVCPVLSLQSLCSRPARVMNVRHINVTAILVFAFSLVQHDVR